MFHRILVPSDGSEHSLRAVRMAGDLAKKFDSEVILLTVVAIPQALVMVAGIGEQVIDEYVERSGREALAPALKVLEDAGVGAEIKIEVGSAADEIVREAEETAADVVIMGKRGLGEFTGLLLGSVSHRVSNRLDVPVLLIP